MNLLKHYAKRAFELREGSLTALLDYDLQHNGSDHSTTITMRDAGWSRLAKKSWKTESEDQIALS